ncbi:hypothetical protein KIN20_035659 [Parelaphostrongylus tenuis]|uniref:UDENN domain-containing protein n=1 Tax=Parelaphostrongylus tenuis TaxID=148309 RepID=A0AAD5WL22_PARTN|nr:hypothetical protein KIN20_035659 [Parelaphostrongylus tenuis]
MDQREKRFSACARLFERYGRDQLDLKQLKIVSRSLQKQKIRATHYRRRTLEERDRYLAAMCGTSPQLFESVIIVSLETVVGCDEKPLRKPSIIYRFPEEKNGFFSGEHIPAELFFPDYSRAQRKTWAREEFVLALTDNNGARKNAYCHKFLPSWEDNKNGAYPAVLVVISPIRNAVFYLDLARNILKYIGRNYVQLTNFLSSIIQHSYPQNRGCSMLTTEEYWREGGGCPHVHPDERSITRPLHPVISHILLHCMHIYIVNIRELSGASLVVVEKCMTGWPNRIEIFNEGTILGRTGCSQVIERISPEITTCIIAALLGEQRILLADNTVCSVSKLVQVMEALIQPLSWPHVFIPAVPDNLLDLCHNPTPYLMGILRNNLAPIHDLIIADQSAENVIDQVDFVFIDADNGLINPPPQAYVNNSGITAWKQQCAVNFCQRLGMPKKASMALITGLRSALAEGSGPAADLRIENIMLLWYASLFGHYKTISCQCEWGSEFKLRLVETQPDKSVRPYLSYLCETVMFHEWIVKRCSKAPEPSDPLPGSEDFLNRRIDKLYSRGVNCFSTRPLAKMFNKVTNVLRVKK